MTGVLSTEALFGYWLLSQPVQPPCWGMKEPGVKTLIVESRETLRKLQNTCDILGPKGNEFVGRVPSVRNTPTFQRQTTMEPKFC